MASSRKRVRGWYGLGSIRSISISCDSATRAGAAAAACWTGTGAGADADSRMRASSPRPKAFLVIDDYLLCKLDVSFGAFTMNVVEYDWLTVAWRLGKADVS